jgi:hypothetical protein
VAQKSLDDEKALDKDSLGRAVNNLVEYIENTARK